ncbi:MULTISPECIES: hypothetical protein [unclassified Streptomyces]|uniref:hypothetical protein n=1 Tax=unclassified Streptomyces TaxID=2593676 RepID=UPI003D940BFC
MEDTIEEVHGGVVREAVNCYFGQFLSGSSHVERAADTAAGLAEQREPLASDHEAFESSLPCNTDTADDHAHAQRDDQRHDDRYLTGLPDFPEEYPVDRHGGGQVEKAHDHGLSQRQQSTGHDSDQHGILR